MSNDVKRRTDPFANPLSKNANTVGNTIGARKEIAKREPASAPAQRPAVDKFSKKSSTDAQKAGLFASNANYKSSNRPISSEKPHVAPRLFALESGVLPKTSATVNMESDDSKLNFLDQVLKTPELHNGANVRKAAIEKMKALAAKKAAAGKTQVQAK